MLIIVFKLHEYCRVTLSWFHLYILIKDYWVEIHGVKSTFHDVPHRKYLSLLFFASFFNGVKINFNEIKIVISADNMKTFSAINSVSDCISQLSPK